MDSTQIITNYWRNSAADSDRMNIKIDKSNSFSIKRDEMESGIIANQLTDKIFEKHKNSNQLEESASVVDVILIPVIFKSVVIHGISSNIKGKQVIPLCISALINKEGKLIVPSDPLAWIPRDYLEPLSSSTFNVIIGQVSTLDEFLFKWDEEIVSWKEYWKFSLRMFEEVTGCSLFDYEIENYKTTTGVICIESTFVGANRSIIELYDQILFQDDIPLYENITHPDEQTLIPLLDDKGMITMSRNHLGQMNDKYSLSKTQRQALYHFFSIKNSDLLAINGPPGTGKTTLIQSIVSDMWVKAALNESEPPIIVVSSTNNQAVNNAIDSLEKVDMDDSLLSQRWLPEIKSFGLSCPSQKREAEQAKRYYVVNSFPATVENDEYLNKAKEFFKEKFNLQFGVNKNIQDAIKMLHQSLKSIVDKIIEGTNHFINYENQKSYIQKKYGNIFQYIKSCQEKINKLEVELKLFQEKELFLKSDLNKKNQNLEELKYSVEIAKKKYLENEHNVKMLKECRGKWYSFVSKEPLWMLLLSYLPIVKRAVKEKLKLRRQCFFHEKMIWFDFNLENEQETYKKIIYYLELEEEKTRFLLNKRNEFEGLVDKKENEIKVLQEELAELKKQIKKANQELKSAKNEYDDAANQNKILENLMNTFFNWCKNNEIDSKNYLDFIDVKLRSKAFKYTMHYWEARWLLDIESISGTEFNKKSIIKSEARWRRYAKITPCIVSTLQSTPNYFYAYEDKKYPLFNYIDLLIIDEAGQVSPHVAGAIFSLAKKAVLIGDTLQIEPVSNIIKSVDIGNMKKYGLISDEKEVEIYIEKGYSSSSGNLMKIGQLKSYYKAADTLKGMFLAEHRRCLPEIIAYCNELAYGGQLICKRSNDYTEFPYPHMGYAHIGGKSLQRGGSRYNENEAAVIVDWVKSNEDTVINLYEGQGNIGELLAIITPFGMQRDLIKKYLKQNGLKDVKVGTVHSFQGAEKMIVLFSPTYDESNSNYFFDQSLNMLNVAVSRAKDSFLVFGNMNIFNKQLNTPSGLLARYILKECGEITDIKVPPKNILAQDIYRISTTEEHRKILSDSIKNAEKYIHIVSPYLSSNAILSDKLHETIRNVVSRNVDVTIFSDGDLNSVNGVKKSSAEEAERLLLQSGAQIIYLDRIHNKSIFCDDKLYIDGSFNWLSAVRDTTHKYNRYESSLVYRGEKVKEFIQTSINELHSKKW